MEVCITKSKLNIHLTYILNEQTLVTYSSIHQNGKIIPIEIPYIKVLSTQYLLTREGIQDINGNIIYNNCNISDAYVHNNLIFIQQPNQFLVHNTNTQEQYVIMNNMKIECFVMNYPRVAIESIYYYIFDDKTRSLIKVGNTEKNKKIGCSFYQQYLFCGRPNGVLWKAKMTGEVQCSYKFAGLKFTQMNVLNDYIFNINQNSCNIIAIESMTILNTIDIQFQQIYFSQDKLLYFDKEFLYSLYILNKQEALTKYAEQNDEKAVELFQNNSDLQTNQNSLLLLKFKSKNIANITHSLQKKQFKFKFIDKKQLENSNKEYRNLDTIPKQCCQWIDIDPIISEREFDLIPILNKIDTRLLEDQSKRRLRKYLNVRDMNMLHFQIIKYIKAFKKWELVIIQKNFIYCRNLHLEYGYWIQLLRDWIRWRNKQLGF